MMPFAVQPLHGFSSAVRRDSFASDCGFIPFVQLHLELVGISHRSVIRSP